MFSQLVFSVYHHFGRYVHVKRRSKYANKQWLTSTSVFPVERKYIHIGFLRAFHLPQESFRICEPILSLRRVMLGLEPK